MRILIRMRVFLKWLLVDPHQAGIWPLSIGQPDFSPLPLGDKQSAQLSPFWTAEPTATIFHRNLLHWVIDNFITAGCITRLQRRVIPEIFTRITIRNLKKYYYPNHYPVSSLIFILKKSILHGILYIAEILKIKYCTMTSNSGIRMMNSLLYF